jgi:hypothetical protein
MRMLFSIIIAAIGAPLALGLGHSAGLGPTLCALALALAPLAFTLRARAAARRDDQTLLRAARDAAGVDVDAAYQHVEAGTAIVLNPATRRLAMAQAAHSKVYAYSDIRSWDARKESASGAVGIGFEGTVAAGSQNIAASHQADQNTGLFLTMRDTANPLWRISMFEASDRARWSEILRQQVNEILS